MEPKEHSQEQCKDTERNRRTLSINDLVADASTKTLGFLIEKQTTWHQVGGHWMGYNSLEVGRKSVGKN